MLELWHTANSTCSQKVRIALAEKGLAWTSHHLNLRAFEQLSPAFLALNPAGMVPVLRHDGRVLRESLAINEYLDEVFPAPALRPVLRVTLLGALAMAATAIVGRLYGAS